MKFLKKHKGIFLALISFFILSGIYFDFFFNEYVYYKLIYGSTLLIIIKIYLKDLKKLLNRGN